jgi:hypothetical protein
MNGLTMLLAAFLLLNAVFWGLGNHHTHCIVAASLGVKSCPPHWTHIAFGLASFVGAIVVCQWNYLTNAPRSG